MSVSTEYEYQKPVRNLLFCAASAMLMSGCASSSGVVKAGPDTYSISTSASPGRGGIPAAKKLAFDEANKACAALGREIFLLSEKAASPTWTEGMANFELYFRCLNSSDPEYQRQPHRSFPGKAIENHSGPGEPSGK